MNEIVHSSSNLPVVAFDQKEIMPYGKIGVNIDWNRVFRDKIWIFHPQPINWYKAIDEQGNFDFAKFTLSRTSIDKDKAEYEEIIDKQIKYLNAVKWHNDLDNIYLKYGLKDIIKWVEKMSGVIYGENRESVYEQSFLVNLKDLHTHLESNKLLGDEEIVAAEILTTIEKNVQDALAWWQKQYDISVGKLLKTSTEAMLKYINIDGTLNVDKIIETLSSFWSWNEETMLMAFYIAKCSKVDLERLQQWAMDALNIHMLRLDTPKVFIILEFVLPYIHQWFKIDWKVDEIFDPAYLKHISIYDLTPEKFEAQVCTKWEQLGWSEEIQQKLITQFKKYGTSKSGGIWFGQGSEQLWYWNGVTGWLNENNVKHYTKDAEIIASTEKMPIPNILLPEASQMAKQQIIDVLYQEEEK